MSTPSSTTPSSSASARIDELQDVATFPPPEQFVRRAKVTDPAIYDQAAADMPAWWARQARDRLHWQTPFQAVLDESNPPFYTWFADGALNASYNCLDRGRGGHARLRPDRGAAQRRIRRVRAVRRAGADGGVEG